MAGMRSDMPVLYTRQSSVRDVIAAFAPATVSNVGLRLRRAGLRARRARRRRHGESVRRARASRSWTSWATAGGCRATRAQHRRRGGGGAARAPPDHARRGADDSQGHAARERHRQQRRERRGGGRRRQRAARPAGGARRAAGVRDGGGAGRLRRGASRQRRAVALGGFVLARSIDPPDVVRLPVPEGLACALLHPHLEVQTGDGAGAARRHGAARGRGAAMGQRRRARRRAVHRATWRSSRDRSRIASPSRSARGWCPGSTQVKAAALAAGALGCRLSGSGPSMFALAPFARHRRRRPVQAMRRAFAGTATRAATSACRRSARAGAQDRDRDELHQHAGQAPRRCRFATAIFAGLAPDGGLYVPGALAGTGRRAVGGCPRRRRSPTSATAMLGPLFGDEICRRPTLRQLLADALELSDSARAARRSAGGARAVSRPDVRLQGRRRARDGAADVALPRREPAAADGAGRDLRRHRQRGGAGVSRRRRHPRGGAVSRRPGERGAGGAVHDARRQRHGRGGRGTFDDCQRLAKQAFADAGAPGARAPDVAPTRSTSAGCCRRCSITARAPRAPGAPGPSPSRCRAATSATSPPD